MTCSSLCRVKIIQLPVVSLCVQAAKIKNPLVEVVLRPEYKDTIKCWNHPVGTGLNFIFWRLVTCLLPPIPKVCQRIFVCRENGSEDISAKQVLVSAYITKKARIISLHGTSLIYCIYVRQSSYINQFFVQPN